jgi:hypothetical protein
MLSISEVVMLNSLLFRKQKAFLRGVGDRYFPSIRMFRLWECNRLSRLRG